MRSRSAHRSVWERSRGRECSKIRGCKPLLQRTIEASVAVVGLAAAASQAQAPLATTDVVYETAPRERIWDGTIEAVNQATVSAQTSGRVEEILYDVNDFVEAGAVIIRLTDTEQRAALQSAQAAAQEAEARFDEAMSEFERISRMYENETVSKSRFDQAQASYNAAKARLEAARSGVTAAGQQLAYTVIHAPYAGIVSARHVEVGELVTPGQPLMSGLSFESLRVNVDVPQSMIEPIRKIGRAYVYTGEARIETQQLTFFPVADPATNTFRVRVELPEHTPALYPGMFVKVGFVVGETQRLLIPTGAVVHRSEVTAVYVVDDGAVALRQIRTGHVYGDRVEVLAGLRAGERIATDPVAAGARTQQPGGTGEGA
jgi:RND family efflux transporter MFP subunit